MQGCVFGPKRTKFKKEHCSRELRVLTKLFLHARVLFYFSQPHNKTFANNNNNNNAQQIITIIITTTTIIIKKNNNNNNNNNNTTTTTTTNNNNNNTTNIMHKTKMYICKI